MLRTTRSSRSSRARKRLSLSIMTSTSDPARRDISFAIFRTGVEPSHCSQKAVPIASSFTRKSGPASRGRSQARRSGLRNLGTSNTTHPSSSISHLTLRRGFSSSRLTGARSLDFTGTTHYTIALGGAGSSGLPALPTGTTVRIKATARKTRRLGRNDGVANAWYTLTS
jgi:hypothetical protein